MSTLRKLWPQTLLWRSFLLIVALFSGFLLACYVMYSHYSLRPKAIQTAQLIVSIVNLTRSALIAADATQRFALLQDLNKFEGIRIFPSEPDDAIQNIPESIIPIQLQNSIRYRLGKYTRFAIERNSTEGLFVSFRVEENDPKDEYWLMLPKEKIVGPALTEWLTWGITIVLVALLGAYLLMRGLTRPLKALEQAAKVIGQGLVPEHLEEQGAREISALARAFNQMSRDLAELDSDRALILAGVSHDLRTPLTRLRLEIEMSGANTEQIQTMGQDIEDMDRIIGQFLDFARGIQNEAIRYASVTDILEDAYQKHVSRHPAINLSCTHLTPTHIRPQSLRRAINNLIENALLYGGNGAIDISALATPSHIQIIIADRGPGIPQNQINRLKRPFTRLENARTNSQGSGLGLAIVERIARQHEGSLDIKNREGGGLIAKLNISRILAPTEATLKTF